MVLVINGVMEFMFYLKFDVGNKLKFMYFVWYFIKDSFFFLFLIVRILVMVCY